MYKLIQGPFSSLEKNDPTKIWDHEKEIENTKENITCGMNQPTHK